MSAYCTIRWDEREIEVKIARIFEVEYGLTRDAAVKMAQMDHHAWECEWSWFLQEVQLALDALDEGEDFGWSISCEGNGGSFLVHEDALDAAKLLKATAAGAQPVKVEIDSRLSRLVVRVWLSTEEEPDEVYTIRPAVDEAIWLPEIAVVEAAS